ncbi:MAG: glutathione S-transferase [Acidiphilium sp.]|nr:glutathione S-transferase [Acidiphilium sp.]MDD4934773.1 glutathione S-transferase [Acidiphilium sp.]
MNETPAVLHLGNRRYSSWSLRGWLAVRRAGIAATEHVIPLSGGHTEAVRAISPSGFVPFFEHDGARIWDSLAILEYCAEITPALWPRDRIARAHARAISAEMHSGFRDLRIAMPMNCCRTYPGRGITVDSLADLARIEAIWTETRTKFGAGGTFLFGADLTGSDIMFAPVVARFLTYQPPLNETALSYMNAMRAHPLMDAWYNVAAAEPDSWKIEKYEAVS